MWIRPFDPTWCVVADLDEDTERVVETLLCTADGSFGTRGVLEERRPPGALPVIVGGVFEPDQAVGERLMAVPGWCTLPIQGSLPPGQRVLDLRDGVQSRAARTCNGCALRSARFACAGRPGTAVLRADVSAELWPFDAEAEAQPITVIYTANGGGGVAVATSTTARSVDGAKGQLVIERIVAQVSSPRYRPDTARARRSFDRAARLGSEALLAEQRRVWSRRWTSCDVEIVGDSEATLSVRFALYHLLSSTRRQGESAVGARGLTGTAYAGHVFWDTEAFVLPVVAAVDGRAARSV
ncbi:MAG: hypothetical protein WBG41_12690, partial [Acidimicrobiales bacterium]